MVVMFLCLYVYVPVCQHAHTLQWYCKTCFPLSRATISWLPPFVWMAAFAYLTRTRGVVFVFRSLITVVCSMCAPHRRDPFHRFTLSTRVHIQHNRAHPFEEREWTGGGREGEFGVGEASGALVAHHNFPTQIRTFLCVSCCCLPLYLNSMYLLLVWYTQPFWSHTTTLFFR